MGEWRGVTAEEYEYWVDRAVVGGLELRCGSWIGFYHGRLTLGSKDVRGDGTEGRHYFCEVPMREYKGRGPEDARRWVEEQAAGQTANRSGKLDGDT
jgi:hypothetical protein